MLRFGSWIGVVVVAVGLMGWGFSSSNSLKSIKKQGVIRIAVDATYPPMEFEGDDGKVKGFDVDFSRELGKRLGVDVEFVVMSWDGILAGLQSRRYDAIVSSMNITEDRKKQVQFVPYIQMSQVFVVTGKTQVASEKDLAGKVVAVQADTTSHEAVQGYQKAGLALKEIKAFKNATDTFAAMKSGQAEVIVIDEPVGLYYAKQDPTFRVSGRAMAPEPVGIAIHAKEKDLAKEIQGAVEAMKKDGTLKRLSLAWFGAELGI